MNALTLGLIAAVCWGIHDVTIRKLSQNTPLMATLFGVLLIGALFQSGVMLATDGFHTLPSDAVILSVAAGVAFLLASVCLYHAFLRGPVRIVAPVIGSYPILSVAWAVFQGEAVTLWQWLAVLVVLAGITLVALASKADDAEIPPIGPTILLSAFSSFGFFATFALGQEAAKIAEELPSVMITRVVSLGLLIALILVTKDRFWPGRAALPFVTIMGLLDGIALLCVISAGGLPSAQYAAVASSTFGLITIILAWALLKEHMTPKQWAGCALAFAGIGYLAL